MPKRKSKKRFSRIDRNFSIFWYWFIVIFEPQITPSSWADSLRSYLRMKLDSSPMIVQKKKLADVINNINSKLLSYDYRCFVYRWSFGFVVEVRKEFEEAARTCSRECRRSSMNARVLETGQVMVRGAISHPCLHIARVACLRSSSSPGHRLANALEWIEKHYFSRVSRQSWTTTHSCSVVWIRKQVTSGGIISTGTERTFRYRNWR